MIDRLLYTFWTNKGTDYLCGFHTEDTMIEFFRKSINNSKRLFKEVVIYTDPHGYEYLREKVNCDFEVIDYDLYEFNKKFWCFPKLITYNLQSKPFLHIDIDVILYEKPKNFKDKLVCEKIRPLQQPAEHRNFLPQKIQDNFSPWNICSGILGGDPALFKLLYKVSSTVVKTKNDNVTFDMLFGIEEIVLTSLAKMNDVEPIPYNGKFLHLQSSAAKQKLVQDSLGEDDFKI